MKKIKKGMFITIEGGEGSGKSTLAQSLYEEYKNKDYDVILTREPGGNDIAEQIRNIVVNNDIDAETQLLLFTAARRIHCKNVIIPALNEDKFVICDRYVTSSLIYQGIIGGVPIEKAIKLQRFAIYHNGKGAIPDIEFILNIDPEKGLERIKNRNGNNLFDKKSIDYHRDINRAFTNARSLSIANKVYNINADENKEIVKAQAIDFIDNMITKLIKTEGIYDAE